MGYAVLIGEDSSLAEAEIDAELLVIDAAFFSKDDIDKLRKKGTDSIYTYINIGSIENFREYYSDYEQYCLGDYENWPDEKWIDVSLAEWQEFLASRIAELAQKGIDGFFVDNSDVYYLYPRDEIYEGIIAGLQCMKAQNKKVIINGGDAFVKKYLQEYEGEILIDGVNQEDVYTSYNFETGECGINSEEERKYFEDYLQEVVDKGCAAYTIEYADNKELAKQAREYAKERGYICYVSDNIDLILEP